MLMFIEEHDRDVPAFCFRCDRRLSGPTYRCLQCSNFDPHKQCAERVRMVLYHFHPEHPLTILVDPLIHPETFTCNVCQRNYQGFVYYCCFCNFLHPFEDIYKQTMVATDSHQHGLVFLQRPIQFICDFCGVSGDRDPYVCGTCQVLLHESCISLPRAIKIFRYQHQLFHKPSLHKDAKWECRICQEEIDPRYWSYSCSECHYTVHLNCTTGTSTAIQDGDEPIESDNLIPAFFENTSLQENVTAPSIKHVYHEHILVLRNNGEVKGDNVCDGCMKPVSKSFYCCEHCRFFLHEDCAELPRQNHLPIHKHLLTLTKNVFTRCDTCGHYHHGFSCKCDRRRCNIKIDLHCGLLPTALYHPSHDHKLFLDKNYVGNCSGCDNHISLVLQNGAYLCQPCGYTLDFKCVRLPLTAWYKYDKHDLTLTYHDRSDPSHRCFDICEEEREPDSWFYSCEQCDNSFHIDCIIDRGSPICQAWEHIQTRRLSSLPHLRQEDLELPSM